MYTFSSRLKTFSIVLMVLGILGIGYGFLMAPKTTTDVEAILEKEAAEHHGSHAATGSHSTHSPEHSVPATIQHTEPEHHVKMMLLWQILYM